MATLEELTKKLIEAWNKFGDWVSTLSANVYGFITAVTTELWNALSDAFEAWFDEVQNILGEIDRVVSEVRTGIESAKSYADEKGREALDDALIALSGVEADLRSLIDAVSGVTEEFVWGVVAPIQDSIDALTTLVDGIKTGLDQVADSMAMMVTNFDLWVSSSIDWLLNYWIETEAESEEYKKKGVK